MKHVMLIGCLVLLAVASCEKDAQPQKPERLAFAGSQFSSRIKLVEMFDTVYGDPTYRRSYTYNNAGRVLTITEKHAAVIRYEQFYLYYDATGRVDSVKMQSAHPSLPNFYYKYLYGDDGRLRGIVRYPYESRRVKDTMRVTHDVKIPGWDPSPSMSVGVSHYFYDQQGQLSRYHAREIRTFKNTQIPNPEFSNYHFARIQDLWYVNMGSRPQLRVSEAGATMYEEQTYQRDASEVPVTFQYKIALDEQGRVSKVYYVRGHEDRLERQYTYTD